MWYEDTRCLNNARSCMLCMRVCKRLRSLDRGWMTFTLRDVDDDACTYVGGRVLSGLSESYDTRPAMETIKASRECNVGIVPFKVQTGLVCAIAAPPG